MFVAKRKNGYYYIQYLDPLTNKLKRLSTKTKSKSEALKIFRNFDLGLTREKSVFKIASFRDEYVKSAGPQIILYFGAHRFTINQSYSRNILRLGSFLSLMFSD